jgi:hypothetical protein
MITQIGPTEVVRVYSGRPGCACGCRGKYFEDQRNITRIVKIFNQNFEKITWFDGCNFCQLDISENRTYAIYFAKEGDPR